VTFCMVASEVTPDSPPYVIECLSSTYQAEHHEPDPTPFEEVYHWICLYLEEAVSFLIAGMLH
jgi:hypothetical protein